MKLLDRNDQEMQERPGGGQASASHHFGSGRRGEIDGGEGAGGAFGTEEEAQQYGETLGLNAPVSLVLGAKDAIGSGEVPQAT